MRRFERPIVLALFACWIVGFGVVMWNASQPRPTKHNYQGTTNAEQKAKSPTSQDRTSIKPQSDPTNEKTSEHQKGALETFFEIKLTDVLLVFFTAVLAYRTSGLFVETAGLRDAADKQRIDSLRSIAAAETAAKAAEKSAEVAEKTLFAANRPVITIGELELIETDGVLDKPHISWGMRNSGSGFTVVTDIKVETVIQGIGTARVYSRQSSEWIGTIEPGKTSSGHKITTTTMQARIKDILAGRLLLYFNVELQLMDIMETRSSARFPFIFDSQAKSFKRTDPLVIGDEKNDS